MTFAYRKQILFAIIFGVLVYLGYKEDNTSSVNYKRGILAAALVAVAQGCMAQYTGPFTRGYETIWRGISRYSVIYLVLLVFVLYQSAHDARQLMSYLYPELGKPVTKGMHTYDQECDFTVQNLWDNVDHYFAMHLFGWFFATLMIRDTYFLHFWSILDEVLELSWQHVLPHFRECWWDHIIGDVLCSNTPGIMLGMLFIRKTGLREFDWLGRKGKKSIKEWDVLHNHRRFGGLVALFIIVTLNFLCGFFIMNALWIPPKNLINIYRLTVWFTLGSMSIGELHDDVETYGTEKRRETPISNEYRWIVCGVMVLETVISWKFRHGTGHLTDEPTPLYISIPWIVTCFTLSAYYLYLRFKQNRTTKYGDAPWEIEARKAQASGAITAKTEKKKEKTAAVTAETKPVVQTPAQQARNENHEEKSRAAAKNTKKVETAEPEITEARKRWTKKKAGEEVESPEPKIQQAAAQVQAPEEEEWRTIPSNRAVRKTKKSKRD
jgi:phosphatidylserine synthase 2